MNKFVICSIFALCTISTSIFATDEANGKTWNKSSNSSKLEEMRRVLGNIESRGCKVTYSANYYVRQLDDFYSTTATLGIELSKAIGLIATGAGEDWDC
jgi:hypothetical protein